MTGQSGAEMVASLAVEVRHLVQMVGALPPPAAAPPAIIEDLSVISTQAHNALGVVVRLEELAPYGAGPELDALLHRMNNCFTGIASLATLCRDDVRGAPALYSRLVDVEQQARRAADCVRELARARL